MISRAVFVNSIFLAAIMAGRCGAQQPGPRAPQSATGTDSREAAMYWLHPPYETRNDTRAAGGLSQEEVLALHRELRALVDIHTAPSPREMRIWRQLLKPQWGTYPYETVEIKKGKLVYTDMSRWGLGGHCMTYARRLYRLDDRSYLPLCTQVADLILSTRNDPHTGHFHEEDGARPPLFVKLLPRLKAGERVPYDILHNPKKDPKRYAELMARPQVCAYEWLYQGQMLQGIVNAAVWILDHPEVHDQPAPQVPGLAIDTGSTYLEKARHYLLAAKEVFDYVELQRYFDKKLGVWMMPRDDPPDRPMYRLTEDGSWLIHYRALPLNRYMIFNHAYLVTGIGLKRLDPDKYGLWYERARYVARRGFDFWREHMVNSDRLRKEHVPMTSNKFGPLYIWGYSAEGRGSEDQAHLAMELEAMLGIDRWERCFTVKDLKATANMAFSGLYDYERNAVYKGIFRNPQPPKKPAFRVYSPPFGCLVGKYMPDEAYEKFVNKQLELWDERLAEGKLGRADTYSMPLEILEARLNRYAIDNWLRLQ